MAWREEVVGRAVGTVWASSGVAEPRRRPGHDIVTLARASATHTHTHPSCRRTP